MIRHSAFVALIFATLLVSLAFMSPPVRAVNESAAMVQTFDAVTSPTLAIVAAANLQIVSNPVALLAVMVSFALALLICSYLFRRPKARAPNQLLRFTQPFSGPPEFALRE